MPQGFSLLFLYHFRMNLNQRERHLTHSWPAIHTAMDTGKNMPIWRRKTTTWRKRKRYVALLPTEFDLDLVECVSYHVTMLHWGTLTVPNTYLTMSFVLFTTGQPGKACTIYCSWLSINNVIVIFHCVLTFYMVDFYEFPESIIVNSACNCYVKNCTCNVQRRVVWLKWP